jgi:hypothetical protein
MKRYRIMKVVTEQSKTSLLWFSAEHGWTVNAALASFFDDAADAFNEIEHMEEIEGHCYGRFVERI